MSAEYVSSKPDGYLATRNEVYRDREKKLQVRTMQEQSALRNLPAMTHNNYGNIGKYEGK